MLNCLHCDAELTIAMAFKQPTPFRFKCSTCKTKHKVTTPYMNLIFAGALMLGGLFGSTLIMIDEVLGELYIGVFIVFILGVILILEVIVHRYISKHGVLTIIDKSTSNSTNNQND